MHKRIAIATIGTQGDVQPYLSLAIALKERGYSVVLGTNADFEDLITSYGIEFYSLGTHIQKFLQQSRFENAMSQNMLVNVPALLRDGQKIVETAGRHAWQMAQGADAIIINMNTSFGIDIAEALHIPAIMSALQPLSMTKEFPICAYEWPDLGPAFNQLSYASMSIQQAYYDFPRNRLRRELMGLKPRKKGGFFKDNNGNNLTTLYPFSTLVSPRPRDWPKTAIVTGYWPLADSSGWEPSERFKTFLAAGPKPVYIGFGSMPFGAERNTQILKEAVTKWGGRAVVARGWGGINPDHLPDSIYAIGKAPHDKLFEHVAGVVHHGGAGTTAAGLYAGRPTFVVPQTFDQPYWGRRVRELGCGPSPVRLRKLTPDVLAESLHKLTTRRNYAENAQNLAEALKAEDGQGRAIKHIERVIANYRGKDQVKPARTVPIIAKALR
ncbi:glycosyltransferase [Mariluticola halotolerans]|uniref:glycosyltransferase n=1 Tax=Mariluticola halotolerans TaxID=2909283 RepID=UPI0026E29403|nr:glycosyltransferase [Mariluticola halotolerans]UJQ95625.1 glycosyltransferase [Mariluticola halotolerans]